VKWQCYIDSSGGYWRYYLELASFLLDFRVTDLNLEGSDAFMTRNCSRLLSCATHNISH
jgi:hypothetical protein